MHLFTQMEAASLLFEVTLIISASQLIEWFIDWFILSSASVWPKFIQSNIYFVQISPIFMSGAQNIGLDYHPIYFRLVIFPVSPSSSYFALRATGDLVFVAHVSGNQLNDLGDFNLIGWLCRCILDFSIEARYSNLIITKVIVFYEF